MGFGSEIHILYVSPNRSHFWRFTRRSIIIYTEKRSYSACFLREVLLNSGGHPSNSIQSNPVQGKMMCSASRILLHCWDQRKVSQ